MFASSAPLLESRMIGSADVFTGSTTVREKSVTFAWMVIIVESSSSLTTCTNLAELQSARLKGS